jgi:hypothetical protein
MFPGISLGLRMRHVVVRVAFCVNFYRTERVNKRPYFGAAGQSLTPGLAV